jgi:hypothetical protein
MGSVKSGVRVGSSRLRRLAFVCLHYVTESCLVKHFVNTICQVPPLDTISFPCENPWLMSSKYTKKVMYIERSQASALRTIQQETGIPQSQVIRSALKVALPKYKKFLKRRKK